MTRAGREQTKCYTFASHTCAGRETTLASPNPPSASFHSVPPPSSFRLPSIRASQNDHAFRTPPNPKPSSPLIQTLTSFFSPLVETSCIVVAAITFFFMRFHAPVFAASLSLSLQVEFAEEVDLEAERALEERLTTNLDDTDMLHALMECKIRARKIEEAMAVLDRLIEVELEEYEWPLLKANMHIYNDECNDPP
ncbi:uncharacterized protein LOC109795914 [Cajanus cajan]|uniref:uncharacterized protein LOC109795914 n=1 Tax=Cajanus cajan TaxID=3821 RepID=UPI00098DC893|nr:uncharacterized protein LOC109795914 [Cajanus cajan]